MAGVRFPAWEYVFMLVFKAMFGSQSYSLKMGICTIHRHHGRASIPYIRVCFMLGFEVNYTPCSKVNVVPCGLVVRIRRSHHRGRGSILRMGVYFLFAYEARLWNQNP